MTNNTSNTLPKTLIATLSILLTTGLGAAATEGSLTDQGSPAVDLGPGEQKLVQEARISDSGAGDGGSLDVDSFTISNTGSAADSEISQVTLWQDGGDGNADFGSGDDTKVGSSVSNPSLQGGVVIGSDDDSTSLAVADGSSETLWISVTMASDLTTSEDTNTVTTDIDASDLQSSSTSTFSGDDVVTAGSPSAVDAEPAITSATTRDSDDNGKVDEVDVTFSESISVTDGSGSDGLPGLSIGSYTLTGKDYAGTTGSTVTVDIQESGSPDTDATPDVTYDGTSGTFNDNDQNGNEAEDNTGSPVTSADGAAPVLLGAAYEDTDNDGQVDTVDTDFSEAIGSYSPDSGDISNDWSVNSGSFSGLTIDSKESVGGLGPDLGVTGTDSGKTGVNSGTEPDIDYNPSGGGTFEDQATSPNEADSGGQVTIDDGASPQITSFGYEDMDDNGKIDRFLVDFSEDVAGSSAPGSSTNFGQNDLDIKEDGEFNGISFGTASDDSMNLNSNSNTSIDLGSEAGSVDTYNSGTALDVEVVSGNNFALEDSDGNTYSGSGDSSTDQAVYKDRAAPVVTYTGYRDTTNDGNINRVGVTFSEKINYTASSDITNDWSISSGEFSDMTVEAKDSEFRDSVYLNVTGTDLEKTGTSSSEPSIGYSQSGDERVRDQASTPNEAKETGEMEMSDNADPVRTGLGYQDSDTDGEVDQVIAIYTESLVKDGTPVNDFTLNGEDAGTTDSYELDSGNIKINVSGTPSRDTSPELNLSLSNSVTVGLDDGNANYVSDFTDEPVTDAATPVLTETVTKDTDTNGAVDQVQINFSEAVNLNDGIGDGIPGLTLDNSDMTIAVSDYDNGDSVTVSLENEVSGTSVTPGVSYSSPGGTGIVDQNQNLELSTSVDQVTQTDEADPVVDYTSGTNMVSFPSRVGTYDLDTVLSSSNENDVDALWRYSDGDWESYKPSRSDSQNDFNKVEGGYGYVLETSGSGRIVADVDQGDKDEKGASGVELISSQPWHLIGVYQESPTGDLGSAGNGLITNVGQVVERDGSGSFQGTTDLSPGNSYWVSTNSDRSYNPVFD